MEKSFSFAKLFSAVACLPVVGLSAVACLEIAPKVSENKNSETEINQNMSQNNDFTENNVLVGDENNSVHSLSGVYSFSDELTVNDIVYDNESALLNFFGVRNLASAKNELLKLGIEEYIKELTEKDGTALSYLFYMTDTGANKFTYVTKSGEDYVLACDEATHSFSASEDGYVVDDDSVILSYDSETNEVTLLFPYTCTNASGETMEIYLQATLLHEENTDMFNYEELSIYKYSEGSAEIVVSSEDDEAYAAAIATLKEVLELDEEIDALEALETILSSKGFCFNNSDQRLLLIDEILTSDDELVSIISIIDSNDGVYSILGLDFTVQETETEGEIKLIASLDADSTLEITLVQIEDSVNL